MGNGSYPTDELTIIELEVLDMKFKLLTLAFLGVLATPVFSQTNNIVERSFACSINDGYTMRDVVDVARNFAWPEELLFLGPQ